MEEGNIRASPSLHKNVFLKCCEVTNLAKFAPFQSTFPGDVTNIVLLFVRCISATGNSLVLCLERFWICNVVIPGGFCSLRGCGSAGNTCPVFLPSSVMGPVHWGIRILLSKGKQSPKDALWKAGRFLTVCGSSRVPHAWEISVIPQSCWDLPSSELGSLLPGPLAFHTPCLRCQKPSCL